MAWKPMTSYLDRVKVASEIRDLESENRLLRAQLASEISKRKESEQSATAGAALLGESKLYAARYRWLRQAPASWAWAVGAWSPEWLDKEVDTQIALQEKA